MPLLNYSGKNLFTVYCVGCEPVLFAPGINEVTDHVLECLHKHPGFRGRIEDQSIVIMGEQRGPDGKKTVQDMLKSIPLILREKLLKKIIDEDGREIVIEAAKKQLESIRSSKTENQVENGVTIK